MKKIFLLLSTGISLSWSDRSEMIKPVFENDKVIIFHMEDFFETEKDIDFNKETVKERRDKLKRDLAEYKKWELATLG